MVEAPQVPTNTGDNNPGFISEKIYRLHDRFIERDGSMGIYPLKAQNPLYPSPLLPGLPQV